MLNADRHSGELCDVRLNPALIYAITAVGFNGSGAAPRGSTKLTSKWRRCVVFEALGGVENRPQKTFNAAVAFADSRTLVYRAAVALLRTLCYPEWTASPAIDSRQQREH